MMRLGAAVAVVLLAAAGLAGVLAQVSPTGHDPYRPAGLGDPWTPAGEDYPPPFGPFAIGGYPGGGYAVSSAVPPVPYERPPRGYVPEPVGDMGFEKPAPVPPSYALPPEGFAPPTDDWQPRYPISASDSLSDYPMTARRPEPPPTYAPEPSPYAYDYPERSEYARPDAGSVAGGSFRPDGGRGATQYEFRPWDESELTPYPSASSSASNRGEGVQLPDYVVRPRFRPEDVGQGEPPPSHGHYAPARRTEGRRIYPDPYGSSGRAPASREPWRYESSVRRSSDYGAGLPEPYSSSGMTGTRYPYSADYSASPYRRDVPGATDPWAQHWAPGAYPNWQRGY